jgi:hypothetical protein
MFGTRERGFSKIRLEAREHPRNVDVREIGRRDSGPERNEGRVEHREVVAFALGNRRERAAEIEVTPFVRFRCGRARRDRGARSLIGRRAACRSSQARAMSSRKWNASGTLGASARSRMLDAWLR